MCLSLLSPSWNHIIAWNTWNHITVCKLFVSLGWVINNFYVLKSCNYTFQTYYVFKCNQKYLIKHCFQPIAANLGQWNKMVNVSTIKKKKKKKENLVQPPTLMQVKTARGLSRLLPHNQPGLKKLLPLPRSHYPCAMGEEEV